ncbi:GGDEF domain-containing protein [Paraburkholderia sp. WC7.3b]|uniref:diguanylate cyclase n=2 Tax=Burkholderiaceae TaxID=119060 RepID=A0ABR7Q297_9BURK|nr:GGDEF domain-containing protein [Paraburkholderia podalyriae]
MFSPVGLYIVGIMSTAVSVLILSSLSGIPGLYRWFGANILAVSALVVLTLCGASPTPMAILISSALLAAIPIVALQGFRKFFALRPSQPHAVVAYVILVIGLVYWTYVSPNPDARIISMAAFVGYFRLCIGWTVYIMRPPHRPRYSYQFLAFVAVLGGLVYIARAIVTGLGWEQHAHFLDLTPMNVAYIGIGILTLPCLSIGVVMLAYDRMAERMERLATVDDLTGALVRREFMARAELLLAHANRTRLRLAVAILDIDHFKAINDGHGHAVGDSALVHFASIMSKGIRRGDIFGRLGGEEFAVLLPETSGADAVAIVDRLRLQIATAELVIPGGEVECTFSAGVSEYETGESLKNLMARSDAALYSAKAMGRNRVVAAVSARAQTIEAVTEAPKPN